MKSLFIVVVMGASLAEASAAPFAPIAADMANSFNGSTAFASNGTALPPTSASGTRNPFSVPTVPSSFYSTKGVAHMDLKKVAESLEEISLFRKGKAQMKTTEVVAPMVNVQTLRLGLKLSQKAFAQRFGFSEATVKNWEQGVREPEGPARILLSLIEHNPDDMEMKIREIKTSAAAAAEKESTSA